MKDERHLIPRYQFRIGDLRQWHLVEGRCFHCGHGAIIPHSVIKRGRSEHDVLAKLEDKARCQKCGAKGQNYLTIKLAPR